MSSGRKSIWWFVGSSFIFSIMSFLIKYASYIDSYKTTMFRFSIGMAILGTLAITRKIELDFTRPILLVFRGICGGIAVFLYYWSISNIGLARGTIISHLSTVFATILSIVVLKERISLVKAVFIAVAFCGLYLMIGSEAAGVIKSKDFIAILGAVFSGIAYVIIKKARETESAYSVFFAQCAIGFWLVMIPANLVPVKMGIGGGLILLAIGITATAGQLMMTYAYKFSTVSTGSLISMLTPVFNLILGIAVFRESFTSREFAGMLVVLVSCYMVIMADDYTRKLLGLINNGEISKGAD
ncbi:MAG TPA: DMT family transporter [bacterium]|nr:DMT family transporter [bacterium]